jgi:hypothetical protein
MWNDSWNDLWNDYQSYEFNTVLEVEGMSFMVGKSSPDPSLKLHLYQDVKICDLAL